MNDNQTQVIDFLLHQLANNEQDQNRFNLVNLNLSVHNNGVNNDLYFTYKIDNDMLFIQGVDLPNENLALSLFIRTCLSRVNGEAVLGVFNKFYYLFDDFEFCSITDYKEEDENNSTIYYSEIPEMDWRAKNGGECLNIVSKSNINDILYKAFDYPLRNGKPLDKAIQALHEKMLGLVPEYMEFITK